MMSLFALVNGRFDKIWQWPGKRRKNSLKKKKKKKKKLKNIKNIILFKLPIKTS